MNSLKTRGRPRIYEGDKEERRIAATNAHEEKKRHEYFERTGNEMSKRIQKNRYEGNKRERFNAAQRTYRNLKKWHCGVCNENLFLLYKYEHVRRNKHINNM